MTFEAILQMLKLIASNSNYKDHCGRSDFNPLQSILHSINMTDVCDSPLGSVVTIHSCKSLGYSNGFGAVQRQAHSLE